MKSAAGFLWLGVLSFLVVGFLAGLIPFIFGI